MKTTLKISTIKPGEKTYSKEATVEFERSGLVFSRRQLIKETHRVDFSLMQQLISLIVMRLIETTNTLQISVLLVEKVVEFK